MSPSSPAPKRARKSREVWHAPRDRVELMKAIGAGAAVVLISVGAVLFLGRDHLGGDDPTPSTPVPTVPADGNSTTTPGGSTPGASTPGGSTAATTPATPDSSAPQGSETTPSSDPAATTTLPGAPTP